jgi:hypothetical protein
MSDFSFTTTCSFCGRRFCPDDGPCECVEIADYEEGDDKEELCNTSEE